jgi:hypothetical protein
MSQSVNLLTVLPGDCQKKNTTSRHPPMGRRAMADQKENDRTDIYYSAPAMMMMHDVP